MKTKIIFSVLISLICFNSYLFGQYQIKGLVTDNTNQPLKGVIVKEVYLLSGTRTNSDGTFTLAIDSLNTQLEFLFPGMQRRVIKIDKQDFVKVILEHDQIEAEKAQEMLAAPMYTNLGMAPKSMHSGVAMIRAEPHFNTENYASIHENGFRNPINHPLSTFSIDVDRASYSNIRRYLNMGQLPPTDAVRIEEMINYFNYEYPEPESNVPMQLFMEQSLCPWNNDHQLVLVGLQTKNIDTNELPPSNLVFLIDVSGSMQAPNKLPLVQTSLKMLTNKLRPQDKVAIVVYAGSAGLVLESTPGTNKQKIITAIEGLSAGGSTAGGAGIKLAYKVASENFVEGGNNRIIIATDGDFNIGQSSDAEMERLVIQQRDNGVYLSVLGYGMGNLKDNKLETIADKGNGNYAYIDNTQEAYKVLIEEFGGTLFTVAKDVKIQLEFNPEYVEAYRLIGYENRLLNDEDFNNDKKDAGELGAGHQVTALYEIIPTGTNTRINSIDKLKYQSIIPSKTSNSNKEILTAKIRYKMPNSDQSIMTQDILTYQTDFSNCSNNIKLASAVAQFGMLLRNSEHKGNASVELIQESTKQLNMKDENGYIAEFKRLLMVSVNLGLNDHTTM